MKGTINILLAAVLISAVLPAGASAEKPVVYTVNYPLYYFATRIAGDAAEIVFPVPADIDPAFWMPAPEEIAGFQKADLILLHTNPLANFKVLYPIPTNIPTADGYEQGGMVEWTIKDGYVYNGPRLREEVKEIVKTARENIERR